LQKEEIMAEDEKKCFFCGYYSKVTLLPEKSYSNLYECEYCGTYILDRQGFDILRKDENKFKMACVLNERRLKGFGGIALDDETKKEELVYGYPRISVNELLAQFPQTAEETLSRTLLNLSRLVPATRPFSEILLNFHRERDYLYFFTKDIKECMTILKELSEQGLIRDGNSTMQALRKILTLRSWEIIESLQISAIESKKAFVAMWFDPTMKDFYEKGIKPAIEESGYTAVRIDLKEFNNKICDELIAEIKRSKFLIADFSGLRSGVFFEAGFAKGLGREVIFTVREADVEKLKEHFDTRQYNHIVYDSQEDLRKKLYNRIGATIV
jgi:nucleoside 2-deoxyribosyltransferase